MQNFKEFPDSIEKIWENLWNFPSQDLDGDWDEKRRTIIPLHKALERSTFEIVNFGVQFIKSCDLGSTDSVFMFHIAVSDPVWGSSASHIQIFAQIGIHRTIAGKVSHILSAQDMRRESDWDSNGLDFLEFETRCCILWKDELQDMATRCCHAYSSMEEDQKELFAIFQQILLRNALEQA